MASKFHSFLFKLLGTEKYIRYNRTPRVLCFHGVDYISNPGVEEESLSVELFIKQLRFIKSYFDIISIDEFYKRYISKTFSGHEIVITFDDGYENILRVANPILQAENIPYVVFLSTYHITTGELFYTTINRLVVKSGMVNRIKVPSIGIDEIVITIKERENLAKRISKILKSRDINTVETVTKELLANLPEQGVEKLKRQYPSVIPMTWDQVRILVKNPNVTIGSHCCRHICCHDNQNISDVRKEIIESKQIIEKELERSCRFFAYPNGNFTNESNSIVQAYYDMGFSIVAEEHINYNNNLGAIPRLYVGGDYSSFKNFITRYPIK